MGFPRPTLQVILDVIKLIVETKACDSTLCQLDTQAAFLPMAILQSRNTVHPPEVLLFNSSSAAQKSLPGTPRQPRN